MTHTHEIADGDKRLSIDAKTRVIGGNVWTPEAYPTGWEAA